MNVAEMRESIKQLGRTTTTSLDTIILNQMNVSYKMLAKKCKPPSLRVDAQQFATVANTQGYVAPYPIIGFAPESFRWDVSSGNPGQVIPIVADARIQRARALSSYGIAPAFVSVGPGVLNAALYKTGTAATTNKSAAVVGTGTTWVSATHAGKWIRFGVDSANTANNGKDFGYLISTVNSTTSLTLATPYIGPNLVTASYEIQPASSNSILFDPAPASAVTCEYAWYRAPERLYNDDDVPQASELSEAIMYHCLASIGEFHRNAGDFQIFTQMANRAASQEMQPVY